jgi:hypothetical protein
MRDSSRSNPQVVRPEHFAMFVELSPESSVDASNLVGDRNNGKAGE